MSSFLPHFLLISSFPLGMWKKRWVSSFCFMGVLILFMGVLILFPHFVPNRLVSLIGLQPNMLRTS